MPQTQPEHPLHRALQTFASTVTAKMAQLTTGSPKDQLRARFETFMAAAVQTLGWNVVCTGETPLPDRLGCPDYAVHLNQLLAGNVELKAPGVGAAASRFKGHNCDQFKRFSAIQNILYTDGSQATTFQDAHASNACSRPLLRGLESRPTTCRSSRTTAASRHGRGPLGMICST